jgi:hypothetical protein
VRTSDGARGGVEFKNVTVKQLAIAQTESWQAKTKLSDEIFGYSDDQVLSLKLRHGGSTVSQAFESACKEATNKYMGPMAADRSAPPVAAFYVVMRVGLRLGNYGVVR